MTNEQYQKIPKWAIGLAGALIPAFLGGAAWLVSLDTRVTRGEVRTDNITEAWHRMEDKLDRVLERLGEKP